MAKYDSFAVLASSVPLPESEEEFVNDAGDAESCRNDDPVACLVDARDLRRPCADDGRPGEFDPPAAGEKSDGGADCTHGFPSSSALS